MRYLVLLALLVGCNAKLPEPAVPQIVHSVPTHIAINTFVYDGNILVQERFVGDKWELVSCERYNYKTREWEDHSKWYHDMVAKGGLPWPQPPPQ